MFVKEIMNREVKKIDSAASVREAANRMSEGKTRYLIVTKGSKMVGIITGYDIIKKVVAVGKSPAQMKVSQIMEREVIDVAPGSSIEEAAALMTENKIKKLPVLENDELVGILTAADMVAAEPKMMDHLGELFLFAKRPQKIAG